MEYHDNRAEALIALLWIIVDIGQCSEVLPNRRSDDIHLNAPIAISRVRSSIDTTPFLLTCADIYPRQCQFYISPRPHVLALLLGRMAFTHTFRVNTCPH
ncbi:uncharacterized protein GGS25DRAFT_491536, partial [Hypoxylon fragiforme]|uniref:uncharacterized protein n=1 Tax=Hypoxylon fragiforme TaxID=63214 RepID=UPI0020C679F2